MILDVIHEAFGVKALNDNHEPISYHLDE